VADVSTNTSVDACPLCRRKRTGRDDQRATAHEARTMPAAPSAELVSGQHPGPPGSCTNEVLGSGRRVPLMRSTTWVSLRRRRRRWRRLIPHGQVHAPSRGFFGGAQDITIWRSRPCRKMGGGVRSTIINLDQRWQASAHRNNQYLMAVRQWAWPVLAPTAILQLYSCKQIERYSSVD